MTIITYAKIIAICLVIALVGYFSYDYGVSTTLAKAQKAADKLTTASIKEADKLEAKEVKERIIYREIIRNVETAIDPTKCLDAHPGADIADQLRKLHSF